VPSTAGPSIGGLSFLQLQTMLGSAFLPWSLVAPPKATAGKNGGRTTLVSSVNGQTGDVSLSQRPVDSIVATLVAGVFNWSFTTTFVEPPVVACLPIGTPPTSGAENVPSVIYAGTPTTTGVSISATLNTDVRQVMLIALGNPD
jgi:hypothetical protein